MTDKYDEMTGPVLAEELAKRELPVSGKVDELRDRLREDDKAKAAQGDGDGSGTTSEGEETPAGEVEVPEPRQPVSHEPMMVVLDEDQARILTAGEARVRRFTKHVQAHTDRKYCAGDRVTGIADWENQLCRVLPFGVEIPIRAEVTEDGLERLREADAQQQKAGG